MQPRDFSRDMRSFSWPRNTSRGRSGSTGTKKDDKRSESKEDNREYKNCIGLSQLVLCGNYIRKIPRRSP